MTDISRRSHQDREQRKAQAAARLRLALENLARCQREEEEGGSGHAEANERDNQVATYMRVKGQISQVVFYSNDKPA